MMASRTGKRTSGERSPSSSSGLAGSTNRQGSLRATESNSKLILIFALGFFMGGTMLFMYIHYWYTGLVTDNNNPAQHSTADINNLRSGMRLRPFLSGAENDSNNAVLERSPTLLMETSAPQSQRPPGAITGTPIHVGITIAPQATAVASGTMKVHAVTYASHRGRDDRFCRAVESAVRHDIELVILGWGVPWRGLSQKLEAAYEFTKSLPPSDVILFTDAFDILYTAGVPAIQDAFSQLHADIVFSAECGCWPHVMENRQACFTGYPQSPTPYRYLNSGTWMGYSQPSAAMLKQVIDEAGKDFGNANDQKLIADFYIAGRFGIKLDFYNKLFQSMHMTLDPPLPHCNPVEDIRLVDGHWFNERTHAQPAVFHFNGGGKVRHLDMEAKMWYKGPMQKKTENLESLKAKWLSVPTATTGKMQFGELCGDYIRKEYGG